MVVSCTDPQEPSRKSLQLFESELKKASKNSTVLFLGDNAYPKGLPNKNNKFK